MERWHPTEGQPPSEINQFDLQLQFMKELKAVAYSVVEVADGSSTFWRIIW